MIWVANGFIILVTLVCVSLLVRGYREDRRRSNEIRRKLGLPPW